MNRTGLLIALALTLVVGLLFGIYPELDLKLTALFYDAASKSFPLKFNAIAAFARDAAMCIAWGIALPAIVALVIKLARPDRPLLMSGRAIVFLLVTLTLSAGVLTNLTFKSYWGRPRPVAVTQFNGDLPFVPWWDPRGRCGRNCSFFSGEGATAFWTYAAGMAAAGLCRRDPVRRGHQRLKDGLRRALLYRCRSRRPGDVSGDLAGTRLHLSLAVDPAIR
jgi:lipid A 4'-phosphatase